MSKNLIQPESFGLKRLPIPVPEIFLTALGFRSISRYISILPAVQYRTIIIDDGFTRQYADWQTWAIYASHAAVRAALKENAIPIRQENPPGIQEANLLLIDCMEHQAYSGSAANIHRLLSASKPLGWLEHLDREAQERLEQVIHQTTRSMGMEKMEEFCYYQEKLARKLRQKLQLSLDGCLRMN